MTASLRRGDPLLATRDGVVARGAHPHHMGLGWSFQEEGRLDEARACFRSAIALKPDLANAHVSLGAIHEELGEMAEAEAAFREAVRLQPGVPLPYTKLGVLLRGKLPEADLAKLESHLANPHLPEATRARVLFALGHVLDGRGDYGRGRRVHPGGKRPGPEARPGVGHLRPGRPR